MAMKMAFEGQPPDFTTDDELQTADNIRDGDTVVFERTSVSGVVLRVIQPAEANDYKGLIYRVEKPAEPDCLLFVQIGESPAEPVAFRTDAMTSSKAAEDIAPKQIGPQKLESFPSEVIEKLKTYVYRLIDPRNGETFYVGKGVGNRVFSHVKGQMKEGEDETDAKLKRIWEIKAAVFEVAHVIHRHGMDDATAIEVEAALIDAYPGLTNITGGLGSGDFGVMHAKEIIEEYSAQPAVFQHRALLIIVNRTAGEKSLYDATRFAWKVGKKAEQAKVILAVTQGIIRAAFVAERWLPATPENFPGLVADPVRMGFVGHEAPFELQQLYVGKRVPDEYRKKGAANPIRYTW